MQVNKIKPIQSMQRDTKGKRTPQQRGNAVRGNVESFKSVMLREVSKRGK